MATIRTLFERFSRHRVLKRKLPADLGGRRLYVSPDAALRFWLPITDRTDPLLFQLVREFVKPGAVVWDVGANVGLFSFAAAALAGEAGFVLAIEADPWLASLLIRTAEVHPTRQASVAVLAAAVSNVPGVARFHIARRGRNANSLEGLGADGDESGGARYSFPIPTVTLDGLIDFFPAPSLVKIDIEGAEYAALVGGQEVLSKHRPVILAEVAEENRSRVQQCLHGYKFFMTDGQPAAGVPNNLIALPTE
jgi:FkbM family methyltransferase